MALVADTNSGAVFSLNIDFSASAIDDLSDKVTTTCAAPNGVSLATSTGSSAMMNAIASDTPHQTLYLLGQDTANSVDGGVVGLDASTCAATNIMDLVNGPDNNALLAVDSARHLVYALSATGSSTGGVALSVIDTSNFPTLASTTYTLANTSGPFAGMVVDPSTGKLAIYGQGLYVYDPVAKAVSQVYSNGFMAIANAFIVPTSATSTTTRLAIIPSAQRIGGKVIIELMDLSKVSGSFYSADSDNPVLINSSKEFALVSGGAYSAKTQLIYVQVETTASPLQQELLSYNYQTPSSPNETVVADTSKTKAAGSTQTQVLLNDNADAVFLVTPDVTYEYNNPGSQGFVVYAVPLSNTGIPVTLLDGSAMGDSGAEVTSFATNAVTGKTYLGTNDGKVFIIKPTTAAPTAVNLALTGGSTGTAGVAQSFNVTLSLPPNSTTTVAPSGTITLTAIKGSNNITLGTASASTAYSPNGATISGTFPSAGTWNIIASYPGDSNFAGTTSSTVNVTVASAAVALTAKLDGNATIFAGYDGYYTLKLAVQSGNTTNVPSGDVTIKATDANANATVVGTVSASNAFSGATFSVVVSRTPGTYTLTASYPGDANFQAVQSNNLLVSVQTAPNKVDTNFVVSAPARGVVGSTSVISIRPRAVTSSGVPTGDVNVSVIIPGSTTPVPIGTVSASTAYAGKADITYQVTTAGTYTYQISYAGDANFNALAAPLPTANQTIVTQPFQANLTLTGPAAVNTGNQAIYRIIFDEGDGLGYQPIPAGNITVTATQGSTTLNLGTVKASDATGEANLTYVFSSPGIWTITASYPGDIATGYASETSGLVTTSVTVTSNSPQFSVTAVDSAKSNSAPGGLIDETTNFFPKLRGVLPDTVTFTVKSLNNWTGTLNLAADVPASANVHFLNSAGEQITQIVLPAGGSVTFTAQIAAGGTAAMKKPGLPWKKYGESGSETLVACMLGLLFVPRGRRLQLAKLLGVAVVVVTLAITSSGCGTTYDIALTLTPTSPAAAHAVGVTFEYTTGN